MKERVSESVCMTEKLYWGDSYLKEFSATVIGTRMLQDGRVAVLLDKTAFYPTSGGQPSDTGTMSYDGRTVSIVDVFKESNDVFHTVDSAEGMKVGDAVECKIDWERRYGHMRHHTALHIIDGVVQKRHSGRITGSQIYADRARMDFDIAGMNREMMQEIIEEAQRVVDEDHSVAVKFLTKDEAMAIPDLSRTGPGNELLAGLEKVRVVDIVGFDMQLDGGTHVASTKEVGKIVLKEYKNNGAHNKRVYITLQL